MNRLERSLLVCAIALLVHPVAGGQDPVRKAGTRPARSGGVFEIVSCSLGCQRGPSGFTCSEVEIHVNEEIRITFNQPVDPASVNANSFQVVDVATGRTPPGAFSLDPRDPATLVYRPQMTFDSAGNPVFGLIDDRVYFLKLPGRVQDPLGPWVTSADGQPNETRLQCTLVASLGIADAVPGRPSAKLRVQVVTERDPVTGEPTDFATVPADGAVDVWRRSPIEILFGDLMNPATVANPVTGQSSTILVLFDPDGNIADRRDQVPIPGSFTLTLDQQRLATRALFQARDDLPASGTRRNPGRVVVELAPSIQDLGGNGITNPGFTSFVTEAR